MTVMFMDQSSAFSGVPDENLGERFGEDAINTRFLRVVDDVDEVDGAVREAEGDPEELTSLYNKSRCDRPLNARKRGRLVLAAIHGNLPDACQIAETSSAILRSSRPVTASWRSTGMPAAKLADSWRMRRSPPSLN